MSRPIFESTKTLGTLLTELKARLGFVTAGSASRVNDQIMRSFLQEANDYCYEALDRPLLKRTATIKLLAGSKLYDFHNDDEDDAIDPGKIRHMWLADGDERYLLAFGIDEGIRATNLEGGIPERWDAYDGQIELFPVPDSDEYNLVIEYEGFKRRFEQDTDVPSAPARLVFLYALAQAKAHYRQPDYQAAAAAFDRLFKEERGNRIMDPHTSMLRTTGRGWFVERGADGQDHARYY